MQCHVLYLLWRCSVLFHSPVDAMYFFVKVYGNTNFLYLLVAFSLTVSFSVNNVIGGLRSMTSLYLSIMFN
jgi:hypothetical protein